MGNSKERQSYMSDIFQRTRLLIGDEAFKKLKKARVAVFGIGGVGGFVCEGLVRSGVGSFHLIDNDTVAPSNINRQIIATHSTLGRYKTEVMKERMLEINPDVNAETLNTFFLPENQDEFDFEKYDYVVDAIDTVTAKIALALVCSQKNIPLISSMGTGNKLDPTAFKVADISKTKVCPLAKVMRRELKKRGIDKLKVVYSEEAPIKPPPTEDMPPGRRATPASIAFTPSVAGLIIASEVVKDLINKNS